MTDQITRRRMMVQTAASVTGLACGSLGATSTSTAAARSLGGSTEATKNRAMQDYAKSLEAFGGRLALPIDCLRNPVVSSTPWQFDILVVGSGYGASICAARLSAKMRPGIRLGVIERGKEWVPGTFGDRFLAINKESQRPLFGFNKRSIKNPIGLLNVVQGDDVNILSASGLGGTSLINANVAIRADKELFYQPQWSSYLNDRQFLDPYYDRAEWELGVAREPVDLTNKMKAQRLAAERLCDEGAYFEGSVLAITRAPQLGLPIINRQGMIQRPCTSCGDCMTGCNVGAKNTLAMNYLPLARRHGAQIFTQTEIDRIEKCDGFYKVHYIYHFSDGKALQKIHGSTTSRMVILGAGSLGSTELLLRSQESNLQFSSSLGCSWSGNGDILGFIRGVDFCTNIAGTGAKDDVTKLIGPTIQSNITFPELPNLHDRVIIQDGVSASAYNLFVSIFGRDIGLDHTQVILLSGHDGGQGRIELDKDCRAVVRWPGLYDIQYRKMAEDKMRRFASALGGKYKELAVFKGRVGTVHPLGGCRIGGDPHSGVTNHKGQVFDGLDNGYIDQNTNSFGVHNGLYVVDGASIPTSLGVNPMLTISAIAERNAELITMEPQYSDLFYNQ